MSQPEQPEGHDGSTQDATDENELCVLARDLRLHYPLRLPYASIQKAVRNSCEVCMAFDKAILTVVDGCLPGLFRGPQDKTERTAILDRLVVPILYCNKTLGRGRSPTKESIKIYWMTMEINGHEKRIELFRDEDEQPDFMLGDFTFCVKPSYGPTTSSERAFERARGWLRDCLEHHDCKALARAWAPNQSRPPKRLIDLRAENIRLFDTDTAQSHFDAPYVCLSHRWGDPRHRRLTSTVHTIQKHLQGISWDELPRTFQDAVTICRRMSIDYLWIDSLCILQEFEGIIDDEAGLRETKADFARENSFMATTYQNSLFTISANISTNMDSGIFCTRSFGSQRIRIVDSNGLPAYFRIRQAISHGSKPTDLETRGWTLQESILPARILNFGAFDVSWKCQALRLCECKDYECEGMNDIVPGLPLPRKKFEVLPVPEDEDILVWWRYMVEVYSRRKLTNEQDKLPALSGLAQLYHAATGHTYSAGLWKEILYEDLCWYQSEINTSQSGLFGSGHRPRKYRCPSWSWASLDACCDEACCRWWYEEDSRGGKQLDCHGWLINKVCTIFEVNCKPRTDDAFGEIVPDAFIEIGTALISATIAVLGNKETPDRPRGLGAYCKRAKSQWTLRFAGNDPDRLLESCLLDCRREDGDVMVGDAVYCAPILEKLNGLASHIGCLILKCVGGQRYRRVGFCVLIKNNPVDHVYAQRDGTLDAAMMEIAWNIENHAFKYSKETEARIVIV